MTAVHVECRQDGGGCRIHAWRPPHFNGFYLHAGVKFTAGWFDQSCRWCNAVSIRLCSYDAAVKHGYARATQPRAPSCFSSTMISAISNRNDIIFCCFAFLGLPLIRAFMEVFEGRHSAPRDDVVYILWSIPIEIDLSEDDNDRVFPHLPWMNICCYGRFGKQHPSMKRWSPLL